MRNKIHTTLICIILLLFCGRRTFALSKVEEGYSDTVRFQHLSLQKTQPKKNNAPREFRASHIEALYISFHALQTIDGSTNAQKALLKKKMETLSTFLEFYPSRIDKVRIISLLFAYHGSIDDMQYDGKELSFLMRGRWIRYAGGRMLTASKNISQYASLFYPYSLFPLPKIFASLPLPRDVLSTVRSSDLFIAFLDLPSRFHKAISLRELHRYSSAQTAEYAFLSGKTRVHPIVGEALKKIDKKLTVMSRKNLAVRIYLRKTRRVSGYANRRIYDNPNVSMHALGLALDVVPMSYEGKEAYWLWAKEKNSRSEKWKRTPLSRRWKVPTEIVSLFESYGFIWGGKWPNFDTIHFEYRPELVWYAYLRERVNIQEDWN